MSAVPQSPLPIQLDSSQEKFCRAPDRNVRLLAPAGCGKTLCLLYRCIHLAGQPDAAKHRFLLVTFTKAAKDELLTRLNESPELAHLRDRIEISTLNSWGYRRIKKVSYSTQLIVTKAQRFFTMKNQLQGIWRQHERIVHSITGRRVWGGNQAPKVLMNLLDGFKSLGFDHKRHTDFAAFSQHWDDLEEIGLGWRMEEYMDELTKIEVLDNKDDGEGEDEDPGPIRQQMYDNFFLFWKDATRHLEDSSCFTP